MWARTGSWYPNTRLNACHVIVLNMFWVNKPHYSFHQSDHMVLSIQLSKLLVPHSNLPPPCRETPNVNQWWF